MKSSLFLCLLMIPTVGCVVTREPSQRHVFRREIAPVLNRFCIRCHGVEEREGGLDLRTLRTVLDGGHSGPVIVWGQPDKSLLLKMVTDEKMPPEGARPSTDDIAVLTQWIEHGGRSGASPLSGR